MFLLLQLQVTQDYLTGHAVRYLENQTGTRVAIERFSLRFPRKIALHGFYIEDMEQDTLLYSQMLAVDIAMWQLFRKKVVVRALELTGVTGNIYRHGEDQDFNYQFLIDAFSGTPEPEVILDDSQAEKDDYTGWELILIGLHLENINLRYLDEPGGDDFALKLGLFKTRFLDFDLYNMAFYPDVIEIRDSRITGIQKQPFPPATDDPDSEMAMPDIRLNRLIAENLSMYYLQEAEGMEADLSIGSLAIEVDKLNFPAWIIEIGEVKLEESSVSYHATPPGIIRPARETGEVANDIRATPLPQISMGKVEMNSVLLEYDDEIAGMYVYGDIGKFLLVPELIDLNQGRYDLETVLLHESIVRFESRQPYTGSASASAARSERSEPQNVIPKHQETGTYPSKGIIYPGPDLLIRMLDFDKNHFTYIDHESATKTTGFDAGHIALSDLSFIAEQVELTKGEIRANISRGAFKDRSGLQLDSLTGSIIITDAELLLDELYLKTAHSRLQGQLWAGYSSLQAAIDHPGLVVIELDADAMIHPEDLRYFDDQLLQEYGLEEFAPYPVIVRTVVSGTVDNLSFAELTGELLESTTFSAPGRLSNVTDPEKITYHFPDIYVSTTGADLYLLLGDAIDQETIKIPEQYELRGNAEGSADSMVFDLILDTESGSIASDGRINWAEHQESFSIRATVEQLMIGEMLYMGDTLGPLTMQAELIGTGFDPETMKISGNFNIDTVSYLGFGYRDISGTVEGEDGIWQAVASSPNEQLDFDLTVDADFRDTSLPVFRFDLELRNLMAHAVYPMDDNITVRVTASGTVWGTDPFHADMELTANELYLNWNGEQLRNDSLILELTQHPDSNRLYFVSDYLTLLWESNINFEELPRVIKEHINHYVQLFETDSIAEFISPLVGFTDTLYTQDTIDRSPESDRYFVLEAEILNTSLFTHFLMPDLERMVPQTLEARYSQADRNMAVDIRFPAVVYGDYQIDSIMLEVSSDHDAMQYSLKVGSLSYNAYTIKHLSISGDLADGKLNNVFNIKDDEGEDRFLLGGYMIVKGDSIIYSIYEDQFIMEYEPWQVSSSNLLVFTDDGIRAEDFIFTRDDQMFGLSNQVNDDLELVIKDFELEQIGRILNQDENIIAGKLSGNGLIRKDTASFYFETEFVIRDLEYHDQYVGEVNATVHTPSENKYEIDLQLMADNYHGRMRGYYELTEDGGDAIDMEIELYNMKFSFAEPFAEAYITDLSGTITGDLHITGSSADPSLLGFLQFNEAAFDFPMLGNRFMLNEERIQFDQRGLHFNQFVLRDMDGNRATLSGSVLITDLSTYDYNLSLRAENFRVVDTEEWVDDMYRGRLIADARLEITGNQDLPRINGTITVKNNSSFYLMIPAYEATLAEMDGVIEFVDLSEYDPEDLTDTTVSTTALTGFQVSTVIRSEPNAEFTIFIDPSGNDILHFRGNAQLDLDINPAGVMNLTGRYEIVEGNYQLLFMGIVPRRFAIVSGSGITWYGDIMKPLLSIQAHYTVRASPENLLRGRLAEVPPQARQAYPFTVHLNMSKELMSPDISFGIEMAEDARGAVPGLYPIIQELNQDQQINELNKQVFSLIVLNSFLAQDPLSGSGGGGTSATARRSVSNLLTQQLNRLASRYVTGFDLSIGIESYEDFTTGEPDGRTELTWGLSRRFFDDRLTIEVGGSVDVEGEQSREQQELSDIAGNVSAEYSLGEARRWRIRGFREQTFENVIDGQLIHTGIGLIYVRDYNRLQELFRRAAQESEQE